MNWLIIFMYLTLHSTISQGERPDKTTVLYESFLSSERQQQIPAFEILCALGPNASKLVPKLVSSLKNQSPRIRKQSAIILSHIGNKAHAAIPALARLLSDQDSDVRQAALSALAIINPDKKQVIAMCKNALNDKSSIVQIAAIKALASNHIVYKDAFSVLAKSIQTSDVNTRVDCIETLATIREQAKPFLPIIGNCVRDPSPFVRSTAVAAIVLIDPQGNYCGSIPLLCAASRDSDPYVRMRALMALSNKQYLKKKRVIHSLSWSLQHDEDYVRVHLIQAIGRSHQESKALVSTLVRILNNPKTDSAIRVSIIITLRDIASPRKEIVNVLRNMLGDKDKTVKKISRQILELDFENSNR